MPGFVRTEPEGHQMDSPNARLAPGRDNARPSQNGPPGGRALP